MLSECRAWVQEEDKCLRFIYERCHISKWSQVARQLADHGWRGRNGKQCKQRYTTYINPAPLKEDWNIQQETLLFSLHNEIGNKWAVIGKQLGGKSDNCVKNHFYSRLRRALKRINGTVAHLNRKDLKEFKPTILYRVVEVAEEKFKVSPAHDKEYYSRAGKLKNDLIELAYAAQQEEDEDDFNCEEASKLITEQLAYFSLHYRKRGKKTKGGHVKQYTDQGLDLLHPNRYVPGSGMKQSSSQHDESEGNSDMLAFSEVSQEYPCDDVLTIRTKTNTDRRRRSSGASMEESIPPSLRARTLSHGNLMNSSLLPTDSVCQSGQGKQVIEGMLDKMKLLQEQEEEELAPHPLLMKRDVSQKSRNSDMGDEQAFRFFDDSSIELRIMPQMGVLRGDSHCEESIFN